MAELVGNLLVAQSGGPTSVINSSLAGVIQEAGRHEFIEEIYGGANGILGILNEDLIDLNDEKTKSIAGLRYTPAAALGTCRYKVDFNQNDVRRAGLAAGLVDYKVCAVDSDWSGLKFARKQA
jgi:6-phosphofructokinase 1